MSANRFGWAQLRSHGWPVRLFLATLTTALMLSDDFVQQLFTSANLAQLEAEYLVTLWVINVLLWWTGKRWFANAVVGLFAAMQIVQLSHIAMTGTPLAPYDIGKLAATYNEIGLALSDSFIDHSYVMVSWALPWGLCVWVFNRYLTDTSRASWVPLLLVVLILGSKPERATRRDMIAFMPGPTRSSLHNSINSFSFYATRMLGRESELVAPSLLDYEVRPIIQPDAAPDNIVLIIADSLRPDRMQINGYHRATTPYLQSLATANELQFVQGLAASVATGASLPLLMNVVREPGHLSMLKNATANLFRRAKEAGYKTTWLSTQESKVLHGLGAQYIDTVRTLEDDPILIQRYGDDRLLQWLHEMQWGDKNFVVLLSRSVHSPYADNYQHLGNASDWWPDDGNLPLEYRLNNAYDNALMNFDRLLKDKITRLKDTLPGKTVVILTSDHGQMLGESNRWGHNRLYPAVASVPIVVHQWYATRSYQRTFSLPDTDVMSHYELGRWLLKLMQFELINPQYVPDIHYFQGEAIYQDNLYRRLIETESGVSFCQAGLVSDYVPHVCELARSDTINLP